MNWLFYIHARMTDTRWMARISPAMVVVIFLAGLGATGVAMHLHVHWAVSSNNPSRWRQTYILVASNLAIILLSILIALVHIRRHNPDRAERAAKMRTLFISLGLFVVSGVVEGSFRWSRSGPSWLREVFETVAVLGFMNFARAIYLVMATRPPIQHFAVGATAPPRSALAVSDPP